MVRMAPTSDAGAAGLEAVSLDLLELGVAGAVAAIDPPILAHVGVLHGLAIDGPRAAVTCGGLLWFGIAMREDQAEILVPWSLRVPVGAAGPTARRRKPGWPAASSSTRTFASCRTAGPRSAACASFDEMVEV